MPPFCEEHQRFHSIPGECWRMKEAARRLAADKARRKKAERIADQVMEDMTGTESLHWIATAAALTALIEMENQK